MLELKRSLINRKQIMINVLKAFAPIISMCSLHVIRLSKITPLHTSEPFRGPFNAFGEDRIENTS
jgi:hypothetical protein